MVQHLNSFAHRGKTIKCPACGRFFTASTGLVNHLESGSCSGASDLNLESIHGWVKQKFPSLTTGALPRFRHRDASPANKVNFELKCPDCDRRFVDKAAWNQHMSSQARESHPRRILCCLCSTPANKRTFRWGCYLQMQKLQQEIQIVCQPRKSPGIGEVLPDHL